jgi:hemerythrin
MSLLKWKPEYSVGIESMDDEHRDMINLINTTYEKLEKNSDAEQIEDCLGEILSTISAHFALEERVMRRSRYAEYQAHKDDHEKLLDQIRDLMDVFFADPVPGGVRLQERLSSWFAGHFSSFDARLHGQLQD